MATCLSSSLIDCQIAMVGLAIRPIAELNHNRIEGLPKDGKEGRRGGKHFFFFFFFLRRDVIAVVEARGGERNI